MTPVSDSNERAAFTNQGAAQRERVDDSTAAVRRRADLRVVLQATTSYTGAAEHGEQT